MQAGSEFGEFFGVALVAVPDQFGSLGHDDQDFLELLGLALVVTGALFAPVVQIGLDAFLNLLELVEGGVVRQLALIVGQGRLQMDAERRAGFGAGSAHGIEGGPVGAQGACDEFLLVGLDQPFE